MMVISIIYFILFPVALVSVSEEVRSRCHVKHTVPRWPTEAANGVSQESSSATQNVRRQKSWDMLDSSAISFARQQQHKVPHQVNSFQVSYDIIYK